MILRLYYNIPTQKNFTLAEMNKILIINGSLRKDSSCFAITNYFVENIQEANVEVYESLDKLPHFNDSKELPIEVLDLKEKVKLSNIIIIVSPEYAFGIPGTLKNAIDWLVSGGEFYEKYTVLITAATNGTYAHESWLNILKAITANIEDGNSLLIRFVRSKLDKNNKLIDEDTVKQIQEIIARISAKLRTLN